MVGTADTERVLWYLLAASRGGATRVRILAAILERPMNLNQLAKHLGIDYKTADHNVRVLTKHRIVVKPMQGTYGSLIHPSKDLLAAKAGLDRILASVASGSGKRAKYARAEGEGV